MHRFPFPSLDYPDPRVNLRDFLAPYQEMTISDFYRARDMISGANLILSDMESCLLTRAPGQTRVGKLSGPSEDATATSGALFSFYHWIRRHCLTRDPWD